MDNAAYLAAVERAVDRLAQVTAAADLDAPVPTCPEWDVATLVGHVAEVHTWVRRLLAGAEGFGAFPTDVARPQRTPAAFAAWYREVGTAMVADLAACDADEPCWTFAVDNRTVGFWPRRQTHEVNVHAFDLALAAGGELVVDAAEAADGMDELLRMFGPRMASRGIVPTLSAPLTIRPSDAAVSWTLRPGDDGAPPTIIVETAITDEPTGSAATISGPASDIYFAMWNRLPHDRLTVDGDHDVAAAYLASRRVP